jgi:hypothetical protein
VSGNDFSLFPTLPRAFLLQGRSLTLEALSLTLSAPKIDVLLLLSYT